MTESNVWLAIFFVIIYILCDFFFIGYKGSKPVDIVLKIIYFGFLIGVTVLLTMAEETTQIGVLGLLLIQIYQEAKEKLFGNNLEKLYAKIFPRRVE